MRQIGNIVYEIIPGFLTSQAIYDNVMEVDDDVCRTGVESMFKKIFLGTGLG